MYSKIRSTAKYNNKISIGNKYCNSFDPRESQEISSISILIPQIFINSLKFSEPPQAGLKISCISGLLISSSNWRLFRPLVRTSTSCFPVEQMTQIKP